MPVKKSVLELAIENKAHAIIIDDKKARNEALELNPKLTLFFTSAIIREAKDQGIVNSYSEIMENLRRMHIFLPE